MEKTIGVTEARNRFSELVDRVRYQGDSVVLLKSGKPAAVLVPVELFERWKEGPRGLPNRQFDAYHRLQEKIADDLSEDEAMALASEAQQAIRAQPKPARKKRK